MDWLAPLVKALPVCKTRQFACCSGLIAGGHGQVGMLPVSKDAETLKLITLDFYPFLSIGTAFLAHLSLGHVALLLAELLVDFQLDRQSMAIPAGDVGGVEPLHALALDDDVFEDLVQGVADMDIAIGIRRAVMQGEIRFAGHRFAQLAVKIEFSPALHDFRFALWQVAAHREIGYRKIEGFFVIHVIHSASALMVQI